MVLNMRCSVDCLLTDGEGLAQDLGFPPEYLNSLRIPGLLLHDLRLKVGAPVQSYGIWTQRLDGVMEQGSYWSR
jgi:hypothetical protein